MLLRLNGNDQSYSINTKDSNAGQEKIKALKYFKLVIELLGLRFETMPSGSRSMMYAIAGFFGGMGGATVHCTMLN